MGLDDDRRVFAPHQSLARVSSLAAVVFLVLGCSPASYRQRADRQTYRILRERMVDPRWVLPDRPVEPAPESRIALIENPDRGPMPPDDPAANRYLHKVYRFHRGDWKHLGRIPYIESPTWESSLPYDSQGEVVLAQADAMRIGLDNSREYQNQIENLYVTALGLTLERFEFDLQWFGILGTSYARAGDPFLGETNTLEATDRLGFNNALAGGGQLLVSFANRFVWQFTGKDTNFSTGNLAVTLSQPLLRGAMRRNRLEFLTLFERQVLYAVRDFAQFRRNFYVDVSGGSGFLGLLSQVQGIRNQETNVARLEQNLLEHEALREAELVSQIQVDLVFQDLQQGRLSLLAARNQLQTSLDGFKIRLGLPPEMAVRLDDSLLKMFELNDPRLDELQARNEILRLSLLQSDTPPTLEELRAGYDTLARMQDMLGRVLIEVQQELDRWKEMLANLKDSEGEDPAEDERRLGLLAQDLQKAIDAIGEGLEADVRETATQASMLNDTDPDTARKTLLRLVGERFRQGVADLFVTQTQTRVFLIEIDMVDLNQRDAIAIALDNRVELMNAKGGVIDAWRRVRVAVNALKADLDVFVNADIRTDPLINNPGRLDASASTYEVGVQFDGPLNRRAERNAYRRAQIAFERSRRDYMQVRDGIVAAVRLDLRDLDTNRSQFALARQQLLVAVRQVEEAQITLRTNHEANSSFTRDLLQALNSLLSSKNNLIGTWVNYQTSRMNLYRDLGIMEIGAEGDWVNANDDFRAETGIADLESDFDVELEATRPRQ